MNLLEGLYCSQQLKSLLTDYCSRCRYELDIQAMDGGTPTRRSTAQLIITVVNVDDSTPRFERSFYSTQIPEGITQYK